MKKILLILTYLAVAIHFLKDMTQDILRISSPMDIFGNIVENLSFLPTSLQYIYLYGFGGLSFIAEVLLLIYLPKIILEKATQNDIKIVKYSLFYLIGFLLIALLLDPRFNPYK